MTSFSPDTIFYAIGDVHGLADRLGVLHEMIFDHHETHHPERPIAVIHLGDYVDRGDNSKGVIDRIRRLEARAATEDRLSVCSLRGNHEQMMLDALDGDPSALDLWLSNGGRETLESYDGGIDGFDNGYLDIPAEHKSWLEALPSIIHDESRKLVFVHAGVNPATFPDCNPQHYLWTRSPRFFNPDAWQDYPAIEGYQIVHGHTPTSGGEPEIVGKESRINVDTGAVYGGPLTAAIIADDLPLGFLKVPDN